MGSEYAPVCMVRAAVDLDGVKGGPGGTTIWILPKAAFGAPRTMTVLSNESDAKRKGAVDMLCVGKPRAARNAP